jgi:hypothetical protein
MITTSLNPRPYRCRFGPAKAGLFCLDHLLNNCTLLGIREDEMIYLRFTYASIRAGVNFIRASNELYSTIDGTNWEFLEGDKDD